MALTRSWLRSSVGVILILTGFSTAATAQQPAEVLKPPGAGATNDRAVQLVGHVVCRDCTLDTVSKEEQQTGKLYELASAQGTLVLRVENVKDNGRWQRIPANHRLTAQAATPVLQQLTKEATAGKTLTITGLLNSDETLEVTDIQPLG